MWFKRVTVSATHVTSSRAQINKSSTYFNVFRINHQCVSPLFPFQPFCGSHAFSHKHFCSVAFVSDKWSAASSVIKNNCICFSDRHAESAHTFSLQKILLNLVKNIFCPAKPLYFHILVHAQFQNHLCPIRISYLPLVCPLWLKFCTTNLLLLFNNSQTSSEFQILIYTLDPWPLTELDRFQSTTTHVSMPCPPSVSHFNGTV